MTDLSQQSPSFEPSREQNLAADPVVKTAALGFILAVAAIYLRDILAAEILVGGGALAFVGLASTFKGMSREVVVKEVFKTPEEDPNDVRMREALEGANTNIMIADENMSIIYLNATIKKMFADASNDIRKDLPHFDPNDLIGKTPDAFHKEPMHQRRMVESLSSTYKTKITVGGRTFSLIASPIICDKRDRLGTIIEWRDLTEEIAEHKALAEEAEINQRIKSALDVCQTNVMIADKSNDIVYMNETMVDMMAGNQAQLRTALKEFDANRLMGANIDQFHTDPSHQRGMIERLTSTYKTKIEVAGLTFSLIATPVHNAEHERIGTVVEWEDITEKLKREEERARVEKENIRIRFALDMCTTNVMVADVGRNVIYTNASMQQMLNRVESEMRTQIPSFNARGVIGTNIDSFHKNPSHQINMLANMVSTHETDLSIGSNHFRLIINPVADNNGDRLGYVVEWDDVTAEYRVQEEVGHVVAAVPKGDFTRRVNLEGLTGFRKVLGESLNMLCEVLAEGMTDFATALNYMAKGELTYRIEKDYEGMFGEVRDDTHATFERLTDIVNQITSGAMEVSNAASEISAGSLDLSQRTETQASALEETAASMEEIATTVRNNANNAIEANKVGVETREVAEQGGQVVRTAVTAMSEIEESSQKISDIIGVIDEIAFQTNLLALNAAVEAARAGDAGKGFAVVATEVRNLAQRSSDAAKNIKDLISDSNQQVSSGVKLVNETGQALEEIVGSIKNLTSIIAEIASASQEQATGLEEVNTAIAHMDEMTQQNSALVEENTASARSLEEQSQSMLDELGFFSLDDSAPVAEPTRSRGGRSGASGHGSGLGGGRSASRPSPSRPAQKRTPPKALEAPADELDDDWSEF